MDEPTFSWTSCRPPTTSTRPKALTGEMICHAPSSAAALSAGSSELNIRLTANAGPPLTTSSANSSTYLNSFLLVK